MPKGVMVVLSQPTEPAREADYNDWYDNIHLGEVTTVPGIIAARRYKLSEVQSGQGQNDLGPLQYMAVYELDADDLSAVPAELNARSADGRFDMSGPIQLDPPPVVAIFETT